MKLQSHNKSMFAYILGGKWKFPFQARKIHFPYKVGCEFIRQKHMSVNIEC
jgi:hypothetical protein